MNEVGFLSRAFMICFVLMHALVSVIVVVFDSKWRQQDPCHLGRTPVQQCAQSAQLPVKLVQFASSSLAIP